MANMTMGPGYKAVVFFIIWVVMTGSAFYAGMLIKEGQQQESNVEVLSIDSHVVQEISRETKKRTSHAKKKLDTMPFIVDNDGYLNPKFMQLMESAKSNAERRGNETGIIHSITKP